MNLHGEKIQTDDEDGDDIVILTDIFQSIYSGKQTFAECKRSKHSSN